MTTERPRRPVLRTAAMLERIEGEAWTARIDPTDAELHRRLEAALDTLPLSERAAAMVAFGFAEGPAGVAIEQELEMCDADALTRSALQLLRAALDDDAADL